MNSRATTSSREAWVLKRIVGGALAILSIVGYGWIVFAAAPTGGYTAGETLNPNCSPGDTDCTVRQGWVVDAADGRVYNTTDKISIGTNDGTSALTVTGGMMNKNENADGFVFVTTDESLLDTPGMLIASASAGISLQDFFTQNLAGFTGSQANINNIQGVIGMTQKNYVSGQQDTSTSLTFGSESSNLYYRKYNNLGDVDSEVVMGGFATDALSPGVYRAAFGAGVYDYDLGDSTPHVMQYGFSAYAAHADHFVFDVDLGMDTRAYTIEDAGTREEVLYNIVDSLQYDLNGRVLTEDEHTLFFGRHADHGTQTSDRIMSMDADGLSYRSDGGRVLFSDSAASFNTSHTASLGFNTLGPTVQQKLYFDFDNQAFRAGAVTSKTWDPGVNVGTGSIALGFAQDTNYTASLANGDYSVAIGQSNVTAGLRAMALGTGMTTPSTDEIGIGAFGTLYTPANTSGDRLLTIGNGSLGSRSDALTILKNGEVGIGIDDFQTTSNGNMFQIGDGSGSLIAYVNDTTGNWVNVSDERQKQNIQDLGYGLSQILNLRPVSFEYKRNGEHTIGFLAQQVLPIVPESVYGDNDKGYGMSYQVLVPVVVKAIQELNLKFEAINRIAQEQILHAKEVHVDDKLCIKDTCVTQEQLQQVLNQIQQTAPAPAPSPVVPDPETPPADTETTDGDIVPPPEDAPAPAPDPVPVPETPPVPQE